MANLRNFAKTYLEGTYGADDTLFRVVAGGGDRLPTVPFSATVWNTTDYSFASDDPFVEIVTVTEISGDFLTVSRGAETTDATPKNLEYKTYALAQTVTVAVLHGKQDMATDGSAWRIKGNNLQLWNPDTNGFHTVWFSGNPPVLTIGPLDTSDFDVGGAAGTGVFTGTKWFTGEGDPDESVSGADVGDFYINSTSNDYFEKTGVSAWTQRGTFGSGGGDGDVIGPGSSASGNIATFSSNTGKAIQDSGQSLSALISSIAGKETAGAADDAVAAHEAASDPHPSYATDAELSAAISAHAALSDPHPNYTTAAELSAAIAAHEAASDPHPSYATDAELSAAIAAHAALSDPHPTYTTSAEASALDSASMSAHVAAGNPHTQYALASDLSAKGDFFGPGSSTTDDLVAFSNTTGKLGKAAGSTAAGRALLVASTALAQKIILGVKVGKRQLIVGPAADSESGLYDGVTDGTADEVQINAAASALNTAGGGTVVVRPGNYTVADSVLLYSKVIIQLQEGAVIKPVNSFAPTNKPVIGTITIRCIVRNADTTSGNSDVGLYGPGRISAESVTGLPANTSGQDSFVGILLHKVDRWHIDKIDADNFLYTPSGTAAEISDVRQYGAMLSETSNGVMTGCRIRYSGNDNLSIRRSSKNNTIIGNHFAFSRYGHSLGQVCSGSGLIFGTAGTDASDNAFIGNYVEGDRAVNTQQQGGIACHGGRGTLIHGNRIKNCGDGVVVIGDSDGCSVVGNRIYAPVAYGIAVVSSDTAALTNVTIANNTIQFASGGTNEVGVYLWCMSFDIDGCSITGNRIVGTSGSGQKGVYANGAGSNILDLEVTGNTFKNLVYGIHGDTTNAASSIGRTFIRTNMFRECLNNVVMAETTAAGTISNGVIDGNVINSTLASAIGIQLGGATNYNVKNNRIIVSGAGAAAGGETTGCDLNDWIDNRTTLSTSPTFAIVGSSSKLISLHDGISNGTKSIARLLPLLNEPPASNYAVRKYRNSHPVLAFNDTTQEAAVFTFSVPEGSVLTSGVNVYATWTAEATSGTVGWDISFERVTGIDIDSDSWGTARTITAATVSGTSGTPSTTSVSFSQAQLPTSLAAGDLCRIRIRRDVANDNAAGDAELLHLEVRLA